MKFVLLVVWCAYSVFIPKVKGFFSYCDRNETLFVPKGSSATFNTGEGTSFGIRFYKYNMTRHLVLYVFVTTSIPDLYIRDPLIENRTTVTGESTNITITIRDVEKADNGTYVLYSEHRICFVLFVVGINKQLDESIEEHSPAYFYAYPKASDIHRPVINATMVWLVDGKNTTQSPLFMIQDGMIWLASVSRALDRRNVTYRAVQDNGLVNEANYTIGVTYGPSAPVKFSPDEEHYFLIAGQYMTDVNCTVECNPPCKVSWGTSVEENILSLGKVSTAMTGTYTCTATRPGTDITVKRRLVVQVEDEPAWQLQLSPNKTSYFLNAGDTLPEITCTVNCNPPCEASWGVNSNGGKLSLGKVSSGMSGEYICSAKRNDTDRVAVVKVTVYIQDTSAFTIAIAVLAGIQAVTTIIVIIGGIYIFRRNNGFPCKSSSKSSKPRISGDRKTLSGHKNNGNDINETELEHYEDLDADSRNKPHLQDYDYVQTPGTGETVENSMELYENTQIA